MLPRRVRAVYLGVAAMPKLSEKEETKENNRVTEAMKYAIKVFCFA